MKLVLQDELRDDGILEALIALCKSDSNIRGKALRDAHHQLGAMLGSRLRRILPPDQGVTIVTMMRSGLCFTEGLISGLEEESHIPWLFFFPTNDPRLWAQENKIQLEGKTVILADAVINSGKSINALSDAVKPYTPEIIMAANVIQEKTFNLASQVRIAVVRVSRNEYVGAKTDKVADGKGPDTGDRLFNTL